MAFSWVEIDLEALRHNLDQARSRLSEDTRVLAVVKSDAYGHGMVPVAKTLNQNGVDFFGVSKYWEAMELRKNAISVPILVLLGLEPAEMDEAIRFGIRPAAFRIDNLQALSQAAIRQQIPARIHLKVDTGMGRLGVPFDQLAPVAELLRSLPGVEVEGVFSHFAVADEADKNFSEWQLENFKKALQSLSDYGIVPSYAHVSNSAALLDLKHAHYQIVRPGLMLYGSSPSAEIVNPAQLEPVMCFKSKILQLKDVAEGRTIGYGRTHTTDKPSRIATIPVGYDDGYPRLLSNQSDVLVGGRRAPLVGRVSMNMITVDVTHLDEVVEDQEVVLLGAQGNERITAEELAGMCQTINYEIYCSIGHHRYKYFLHE